MRVLGVGPVPCSLMFVGEHPGAREVETGTPFVGRTSQDFNERLNGYDLPRRDQVYLTNLVKEECGKHPTAADVERDGPELLDEIERVKPRIICTLGALSARFLLGDDQSLDAIHGIPHEWQGRIVMPAYHPAAGLHSPENGAKHLYDMHRLHLLLKGKLPSAVVDDAGEDYRDATLEDVWELIEANPSVLGVDTEGWADRPWSLQIAWKPGCALVLRKKEVIDEFRQWYEVCQPRLVFHPALHDLPVLAAFELAVPDNGFGDTSLAAHLLGIEPVAAKPLFFRHAGMQQDDYTEITAGADARIAFDFLYEIATTWPRDFSDKAKRPRRKKGDPPHPPKRPIDWLERTLRLVDRMLTVEGDRTLRQRWMDCKAREVLEEREGLVGPMPEPTLDDVPLPRAIRYAGRDADGTLRIYHSLMQQIDAMELRGPYEADLGAVPMLNRMQVVGMGVDVAFFRALSPALRTEWETAQRLLDSTVGRELNVNSGPQVAEYLYDELGLPVKKRTDTGQASTNDKLLEALRLDPRVPEEARDAIHQIQEVREIRKIKSAFADAIPRFVKEGRIHPRLRLVSTGRPACSDPNLLAFPKHSARGLRIREGFVAGTDRWLGSNDLSQIEMRMFAVACADTRMIAQFRSGHDFHTMGAAEKLGKRPEDVTKEERFGQKAINFGILMGITEHGLLDQYHKAGLVQYGLDDMRLALGEWFRQYPAARTYIQEKHAEARRYGYVRDIWGRLRYIPGIKSVDKYIREEAERQAQATPTQSAAAGLMKRWMQKVWERMDWVRRHEGWYWEPCLWIHDDIVSEYAEEKRAEVERHMGEALGELQQFPVPITSEASAGRKWSEL